MATSEPRTTLVVTRKDGQAVTVGDVRVQVSIVASRVRLRITAPASVRILREELNPTPPVSPEGDSCV
jgi:sRNA-binding carbon storage regulator CsrA